MSSLEKIPLLPFLDIIKYLEHEDKLNLRTTSSRMFDRITAHCFKHWSFNLSNKSAKIPDFIINSEKGLHVHIKEVGFNNIQRIIKFIKTCADRITFVCVYFSTDSCDPTNNLFKRLAAMQPEWTGLTKFQVTKQSHGYVMMDINGLFSKCASTLQELDLTGVVTRFKQHLQLPKLTVLKMSSCHEAKELCRMLAPQLQILHLNQSYIQGVIFSNLRVLKASMNYETQGEEDIDNQIYQILRRSSQTLQHLLIENPSCELISLLNGIDYDFPKLKNVYIYSSGVLMLGNFLNRCAISLEVLHLNDVLVDMSVIQTQVWPQLKKLNLRDTFDSDCDIALSALFSFLQRTPKLERLYIAGDANYKNARVTLEGNLANIPLKSLTMLNCPQRLLGMILKSCCKTLKTLSIDPSEDDILRLSMYDLEFPRLDKVEFVFCPDDYCQDCQDEPNDQVYLDVRRYRQDSEELDGAKEQLVRRVRSVLFQQICGFL